MDQLNKLNLLEKILDIAFRDKKFLQEAVTHRSYLNEVREKGLASNERLEFLGDAILAFWVSNEVFRRFPDYPEGKLTFIRTFLVRTETLTKLAQNLTIGDFLFMSKGEELGGGRENPLLLANTFEAVLGAIFLDRGFETASAFLEKVFQPLLAKISDINQLKDSKSLLQEKVQAQGMASPVYKLLSSVGPDHQKIFNMGVYLENKLVAEGTNRSKQEAEETAAQKALEILKQMR